MANLERDVAKLIWLTYSTAHSATREVIGINAFLEALPSPASCFLFHVIKERPQTFQEAVAYAIEVDAVVEAESRNAPWRKGDCRIVGSSEENLAEEEDLAKTKDELRNAQKRTMKKGAEEREETSYDRRVLWLW